MKQRKKLECFLCSDTEEGPFYIIHGGNTLCHKCHVRYRFASANLAVAQRDAVIKATTKWHKDNPAWKSLLK